MIKTPYLLFLGDARKHSEIPASAVAVDNQCKKYVWVVDEKILQVKKQFIKTGDMDGARIRVIEGLSAGQHIVTAGLTHLVEGMKVRLYQSK